MYDTICISGAGIKIMNILGFLHFLNLKKPFIEQVKNFSGTSAGSIICSLLLVGYSPLEILIYFCKNEINELLQYINTDKNNLGLINIDHVKTYFENMFINKIGFVPTLKQLFSLNQKYFVCCSYNLTKDEKVYFDHIKTPDIKISDAVIASSLVPLMFTKWKINEDIYIDGGIFNLFPIEKISEKSTSKILGIIVKNNNKDLENTSNYILKIVDTISYLNINYELIKRLENNDLLDLVYLECIFGQISFYQTKKCRIDEFSKSYRIVLEFLKREKKVKQD
jgi:predicted acylesterase/phospholipase RssA